VSRSPPKVREAIVCVDDEPLVLHALQGALSRKLGPRFTIELASNGAEAIELIDELAREKTRLRLVVSDAIMPIMDGYALVEWLHEHRPEVLKIIITGYSHEGRINQLRQEAGLLACFPKPWKHEELLAFIEAALAEA
jgi:DNA-binding NtrC family response regulator